MQVSALDEAAWQSRWRHRHVGEKVLLALGLLVTGLVVPVWPGALVVATAALIVTLWWARVPPRALWGAVRGPLVFIVLGVVSIALHVGPATPDPLWNWGPLSVDRVSLTRAAAVMARATAGTLSVMTVAATTPMVDLLTWMGSLGVPAAALEVASLSYRLVAVLVTQVRTVTEAQCSRLVNNLGGFDGWRRRFRAAADLVGTVLVRSWDQARRLEDGLTGRGMEDTLVTLPPSRTLSAGFLFRAAAVLTAIWVIVAAARWAGVS